MATLTQPGGAQTYNNSTGTWSNFTPTLSGGASNDGSGTSGNAYSLSPSPSSNVAAGTSGAATASAGDALNSSLNSSFNNSDTADTIMSAYNAQQAANTAGAATAGKQITDLGNQNIQYAQGQNQDTVNQATGNSKGGIINPGAFGVIQKQSNEQIRQLTVQMNDALANNQASLVTASANALAAETTAMSQARASFLSNYFSTQTEARAEASFQTPEQQQVLSLSGTYPDAGITTGMTLAQAQAAVQSNSQLYKLGLTSTKAGITAAGASAQASLGAAAASSASAGLSSAQTTQQKIINDFMAGNTAQFSGDVSGLISGSTTDATLHAKYDNFPGGAGTAIIANIESQAQSKGWSPQSSLLKSNAQSEQNSALNSGNPFTLVGAGFTQAAGAVGSALTGSGSVLGNTLSGMKNPPAGATGTLSNGTKVTFNANGTITDAQGNQYDQNGNITKSVYFK